MIPRKKRCGLMGGGSKVKWGVSRKNKEYGRQGRMAKRGASFNAQG